MVAKNKIKSTIDFIIYKEGEKGVFLESLVVS